MINKVYVLREILLLSRRLDSIAVFKGIFVVLFLV